MHTLSAPSPALLCFLRQQAVGSSSQFYPICAALLSSSSKRCSARPIHTVRSGSSAVTPSRAKLSISPTNRSRSSDRPSTASPLALSSCRQYSGMSDVWRHLGLRRLNKQLDKEHAKRVAYAGTDRVPSGLGNAAQDFEQAQGYTHLDSYLGDEGGARTGGNGLPGLGSGSGGGGSGSGGAVSGLMRGPSRMKELKLRCTEFNEKGTITLVSAEFQKQQLIAKYGLLPRDLRKIDNSILPHILVRPSAILLNLLHLRVLIMHNRVLVFDAFGSNNSYNQSVFIYDLEHRLAKRGAESSNVTPYRNGDGEDATLPYEFRALEAVLVSVTNGLENEFEGVRTPVVQVLRQLEEDIDRDKLRHLLVWSKKLGTFEQKARLVRDALEELLEADDDLAAMYLTEKASGHERVEDDHTEVEMLLESYHKVADEIVQAAENLVSNIRNTEEIVKAILDANRNSLMLLDLKFSIGTLGLGAGTFIAALYGMNLKNYIEESDLGFGTVSIVSAALTAGVCWFAGKKLRRVQRLSMWSEAPGVSAKGSWAELGRPVSAIPESSVGGVGPGTARAGLGQLEQVGRGERKRREAVWSKWWKKPSARSRRGC